MMIDVIHQKHSTMDGSIGPEATRTRIADTAERLFRSMGYQKTAVADIARELGMSPANIYRFFPSKSAINEAITERLLTRLFAGAEAAARSEGSAAARLAGMAEHFRASSIELFFKEKRMHDMVSAAISEHWGVISGFIGRFLALTESVIRAGMDSGEFADGDAAAAAMAFKHTTLAWHHPMMVEECMRIGEGEDRMRACLDITLAYFIAGLKRGIR
jgi:AcrR family transcriptional regulator